MQRIKENSAQIEIYDAYAQAFQVIHQNLQAALKATRVTGESRTLNGQAKSAALSVFESSKQRFFAAMVTGMKVMTLIKSIETDLAAGHAAIVQIVSTGEAILDRRLAEIPAAEWADLNVDLSPRDIVLTYLQHAFPVQLYEPYTDEDGNLRSRPACDDAGNPVTGHELLRDSATLCAGDSGGPVFRFYDPNNERQRKIIAINTRNWVVGGRVQRRSVVIKTSSHWFISFLYRWHKEHGYPLICGVTQDDARTREICLN